MQLLRENIMLPLALRHHPYIALCLKRVLTGVISFLVVTFMIFVIVNALPGDVTTSVLGQNAAPERIEAMREALGQQRPYLLRYFDWFSGLITADFGVSMAALAQGQSIPINQTLPVALKSSLLLGGLTCLLFLPLSLIIGLFAAFHRRGLIDRFSSGFCIAIAGMPDFLVATVLIFIFFSWLGILPPVAYLSAGDSVLDQPEALVLPVLTMLASCLAFGIRLVKSIVGEIIAQEYFSMALLNGYGKWHIIKYYILRNAAAPLLQAFGLVVKFMVGGVVVVESIFALPGIGMMLVAAVNARDIQETSIIAAVLAGMFISLNILIDIAVLLLNPKFPMGEK